METVCFLCKAQKLTETTQYFCSGCKDSYQDIEIHLDEESYMPPDQKELIGKKKLIILGHTNANSLGTELEVSKAIKRAQKLSKKQKLLLLVEKVRSDTSTDDQSSNSDRNSSPKGFIMPKLHLNSKKIHKSKRLKPYKSIDDEQVLFKTSSLYNIEANTIVLPETNYSSFGNKNSSTRSTRSLRY